MQATRLQAVMHGSGKARPHGCVCDWWCCREAEHEGEGDSVTKLHEDLSEASESWLKEVLLDSSDR